MCTDTIFIVQRRDGDVMISVFAGDQRPEEATDAVAKQVRPDWAYFQICLDRTVMYTAATSIT